MQHWVQFQVENVDTGEIVGPFESGMVDSRERAEAWVVEYEANLADNAALVDVYVFPEEDVFEADTVAEWNGVA